MERSAPFLRVLGLLACGLVPAPAAAQTPAWVTPRAVAPAQLARYAQQLGAKDAGVRRHAVSELSRLGVASLASIEARLRELQRARPAPDELQAALTALRHAAGSRRADDDADLARGVPSVLARAPSAAVLAAVEPLLLLRSLEAMGELRAWLLLARFVLLDDGAWDHELRNVRERAGPRLLPALLVLRSHEQAAVRRFAQAGVAALGMTEPAAALSLRDPYLLSQVVSAYTTPLDYAAMPFLVRMTGHMSLQVRDAARAAVARFGKNAIWQVRELYEELAARPADKGWDAARTLTELCAVIDRDRSTKARALLQDGLERLLAQDLPGMQRAFDALLSAYPDFAQRGELAPGYAALAKQRFARDDLAGALAAYRRALRLSPSAPEARHWRAMVEYASAELSLGRGVADLDAYARALELDPRLSAAREVHDRLSGAALRRERDNKRRAALAALALLLCAGAATLVRGGGREQGGAAATETPAT